ncbi:ABC transporter permease [Sneathiella sp.]|jgi:peptide/nickel transport system permease protein|uniref:ABC transporter permease n=1 Tax=Sneathiella sp. TaxID=1964365 RepID=UPI0039E5C0FB
MLVYTGKRILTMVGILLGVLLVTFVLSRILPGSPIEMMLGHRPTLEQIEAARLQMGLDRPIIEQFWLYLVNAFQGDLGTSLRTGRPVLTDVLERFAATFELVTLAILLVVALGIPLGTICALRQDKLVDHSARGFSVLGVALPVFLSGMILQMLFYGYLGWLPLQGRIESDVLLDFEFPVVTGFYLIDSLLDKNPVAFFSALEHLVLPVLTIAIASLAVVTRITRNMMIEALRQEFILTQRAYGLSNWIINFRYAMRAALIPMLTVIGLAYGYMLGGAVVVEFVFDWPGLGAYVVGAITENDYPAVMAVTLCFAGVYLTVNLIIDLLYFLVDPRLQKA